MSPCFSPISLFASCFGWALICNVMEMKGRDCFRRITTAWYFLEMLPSRQQGQQFEQECDFLLQSQQLWKQDVINQSVRSFTFLRLSFSPKISLPLVSFWICSCWITSWSWLKKRRIKKDLTGITLSIFRLLLDCYSNNRWGRSSALPVSFKLFTYKKTEHISPTFLPHFTPFLISWCTVRNEGGGGVEVSGLPDLSVVIGAGSVTGLSSL